MLFYAFLVVLFVDLQSNDTFYIIFVPAQVDGEENGRSRRQNRKNINYAELNEVYLPPLSPSEEVGRRKGRNSERTSTKRGLYSTIQTDYLAPRVWTSNRRGRGSSPKVDTVEKGEERIKKEEKGEEKWKEEEEGSECEMEDTGVVDTQSVSLTPTTCSGSDFAAEASVMQPSSLDKGSRDLFCHEDNNVMAGRSSLSPSFFLCRGSVAHGFNGAMLNNTSSTSRQLGHQEGRDSEASGGLGQVTTNESAEVHRSEEELHDHHPHQNFNHNSSTHALSGMDPSVNADGSTFSTSLAS